MKKFTEITETFAEKNPGNALGVTNHYTPVQNILTNINNLFCVRLSIVASVAEDGFSIKLTSSRFTSKKAIDDLLYLPLYYDSTYDCSTLSYYLTSQGLTKRTDINLGGYYIVYFGPADIKAATGDGSYVDNCPCPCEMKESNINEIEINQVILKEDSNDEEEMEDTQVKEIMDLLNDGDKVKAAKQLDELVSKQMDLPDEYYFAGIKFKNGTEAIALRWKHSKKLPHNIGTIENVRSLMHIFGSGDDAIWVQDWDKESIVKLPKDVDTLLHNILDIFGAEETDDPAVFKITGERKPRKHEDKDDENKKDDEKDEGVKMNMNNDISKEVDKRTNDEEDVEDDNSRGE